MELRQLRYFVVVAEELNFIRAAQRLSLAQPALSQQIRQLEDELAVTLFDRRKRQIRLTITGQVFLDSARRVLAGAETAINMAQKAERGELGRLVVGCTPIVSGLISSSIYAYQNQFPEVTLDLQELLSNEQVQALQTEEIDVGFMLNTPDDVGLSSELVNSQPSLIALPEKYQLTTKAVIDWEDLAPWPFIIFPRRVQPSLFDQIMTRCRLAGFSPRLLREVAQMETIWNLVAAGMGVAPVASHQAREVSWRGVVCRPLSEPVPRFDSYIVWRSNDISPTLHNFLNSVRQNRLEQDIM